MLDIHMLYDYCFHLLLGESWFSRYVHETLKFETEMLNCRDWDKTNTSISRRDWDLQKSLKTETFLETKVKVKVCI